MRDCSAQSTELKLGGWNTWGTEAFCSFVSLNKSLDCSSFVLNEYNKWFLCEMISEIPSIFQVIDSVVLIDKNITARGFLLKLRLLVSWLLISVKVKIDYGPCVDWSSWAFFVLCVEMLSDLIQAHCPHLRMYLREMCSWELVSSLI